MFGCRTKHHNIQLPHQSHSEFKFRYILRFFPTHSEADKWITISLLFLNHFPNWHGGGVVLQDQPLYRIYWRHLSLHQSYRCWSATSKTKQTSQSLLLLLKSISKHLEGTLLFVTLELIELACILQSERADHLMEKTYLY